MLCDLNMTEINTGETLLQKFINLFYIGSLSIEIKPQEVSLMTWDWQQKFLDATVNSELVKNYPPSRQFTKLFLKKIIEYIEGNQEVHDNFYSHLCLTMNNGVDDGFSYRHYLINKREIITIKETNKMVVNGTTGMRTWEAALMLADWAIHHKEMFTDKVILELGSGVGFTGITIGKLCQPQLIYLSDCHCDVLNAICDNISINYPQSQVTEVEGMRLFKSEGRTIGVIPLNWHSIQELPNNFVPDVVIGADVVYDPSILQPLCEVLRTLFNRNKHLEVYIASVIRNKETFESFLKCLDKMNFVYQKLLLNSSGFIEWDSSIERCLLKINSCL